MLEWRILRTGQVDRDIIMLYQSDVNMLLLHIRCNFSAGYISYVISRNDICKLFFQVLMFRCFRPAPYFSGFQDEFCSVFMLSPLPLVPWCVLNYPLHRCHLRVIIFLLVLSCYVGGIALP